MDVTMWHYHGGFLIILAILDERFYMQGID